MPAFDINKVRADFPNLNVKVRGKTLVYLDNAATTLKPKQVIDAIDQHYRTGVSNVHRGVHYLSEQATLGFEGAREKVRNFLNAKSVAEIIFTKGATEAINLVAQSYGRGLKAGDEVIISNMEHHSNIVPWQILCQQTGAVLKVVPINDAGEFMFDEYLKLLSPKTKVVAVVYVSNSLGTINPVAKIIDAAHKVGAKVLIDAAQAVTHEPIDVQKLDCDFLVFSGHKIFGPTGIGALYGKQALLEQMPPYQGGGDMIKSVSLKNGTTYNALPYKFEAGTPPIAEAIGLGVAIDYVQQIGMATVAHHRKDLLAYGTQVLSKIPGLKLIGTAKEKTSILSFVMEGIHPHDLGTIVDEEGVAIRTGHHCTQPVMERFGIPATARASLAFYNTKEELDALVNALHTAKKVFGV